MSRSGRLAALLALVSLGAFAAVVSGGDFLEAPLLGAMPMGNALLAVALCAASGAAEALTERGSWARRAATGSLLASASWLPVSVALSGNLALNFSGAAGTVWIALTVSTVAAALGVLGLALLRRLYHAYRNR